MNSDLSRKNPIRCHLFHSHTCARMCKIQKFIQVRKVQCWLGGYRVGCSTCVCCVKNTGPRWQDGSGPAGAPPFSYPDLHASHCPEETVLVRRRGPLHFWEEVKMSQVADNWAGKKNNYALRLSSSALLLTPKFIHWAKFIKLRANMNSPE